MTPKLTMNESTAVVDAILNSCEPISGTTVPCSPTMPPTKALMRTSNENCCQLARNPNVIVAGVAGMLISG